VVLSFVSAAFIGEAASGTSAPSAPGPAVCAVPIECEVDRTEAFVVLGVTVAGIV